MTSARMANMQRQQRATRRILTRIALVQAEAGMSGVDLARRAGVGRSSYVKAMGEATKSPTLATVLAMADALGMTLEACRPHHIRFHDLTEAEADALVHAATAYVGRWDDSEVLRSAIRKYLSAKEANHVEGADPPTAVPTQPGPGVVDGLSAPVDRAAQG